MKYSLTTLMLFCSSLCGCAGNPLRPTDRANLQGVWLAQTESQNGRTKDVTYQYVFRGDRLTFTDETGKEMKYSYQLETAGQLKLIAIRPEDTSGDPTPVSVAYELRGDSLKLVIAPPGLRPTDLSDKNDQELIVCRRERA